MDRKTLEAANRLIEEIDSIKIQLGKIAPIKNRADLGLEIEVGYSGSDRFNGFRVGGSAAMALMVAAKNLLEDQLRQAEERLADL